jgi:hypothetical protein
MAIEIKEMEGGAAFEQEVPEACPQSIFCLPAWLDCFKTATRVPIYLRFEAEGKPVGRIGGLRVQSSNGLLRKLYRPLFFFSGPAVVPAEPALMTRCMEALLAFAGRRGYSRIVFYSWDYPLNYDLSALPLTAQQRKEYLLDLSGEAGNILQNVRRFIRQNAKRAQRRGVTCGESHSEQMAKELGFLLEKTKARRVGKGQAEYDYYYMPFLDDTLVAELIRRRSAELFYAQTPQEVLSAVLLVSHGKRAYALLSATSPAGYAIGANHLLWLYLIEKKRSAGVAALNLGGVPGGAAAAGLTFYKLSLGAKEQVCMGGATKFLRGVLSPFNPLLEVYDHLNREQVKRVLGPHISQGVRLWKNAWFT